MTDVPSSPPGGAGLISTETAAKLLMISIEWVRRLTREGAIRKVGKDQYRVVDVVQGYITYLRDEARKTSKSAAASRIQDERAEEIRLRNAERKRTLIEQAQAEVIRVVDEIAGPLRSDLMAIPAQVTKDLKLRRVIEERIDGAFGAASKRAVSAAASVAEAGTALGATRKAKPRRVGAKQPRVSTKSRPTRAA